MSDPLILLFFIMATVAAIVALTVKDLLARAQERVVNSDLLAHINQRLEVDVPGEEAPD